MVVSGSAARCFHFGMELIGTFRNIVEIGFGLLFLIGAIFNASYTLRHGEEFYGSFSASAWFRPARKLVRRVVMPHAKLFTVLLIVVQASIAVMILSRGSLVEAGLIAGAAFSLAAVPVSNVPGAIANFALAAIQALLVFTR
jgi:hypothetical protein